MVEMRSELHAGRLTLALPTVWLLFLFLPVAGAWDRRDEPRVIIGFVATLAFGALYAWGFELMRRRRLIGSLDLPFRDRWLVLCGLFALTCVMQLGLGQSANSSMIFTSVIAAMALPGLQPSYVIAVLASWTFGLTVYVDGWETDYLTPSIAGAAGLVMFGVKQVLAVNLNLIMMRDTQQALAVEQERGRFSRDLHDILGHSLTVVAVKAELAQRLMATDPEAATREVREIERLSRDALADIRKAVRGYQEVSLPAEIARAREALTAADIAVDLPNAVEEVTGPARELFAWVIREGVTNVLRHSHATACSISIRPDVLTITDNGGGPSVRAGDGTGITGLRRRAEDVGATIMTRALEPRGFELTVRMSS
jgi:two-component system sensor histidine kinase DesK